MTVASPGSVRVTSPVSASKAPLSPSAATLSATSASSLDASMDDTTTAPAAVTLEMTSGAAYTSAWMKTSSRLGSEVVTLILSPDSDSEKIADGHESPEVSWKPHAPGMASMTRAWMFERAVTSSAAVTAPSQKHPSSLTAEIREQHTRQPMSSSKISDTLSSIGMHDASAMTTANRQLVVDPRTMFPSPVSLPLP